jgi:hypothetical protein
MTVQHADLFHCLACGRVAYESRGGPAPDCCDQPMVLAVADVVKEGSATGASASEARGGVEEHALFAEVVELSQWCHRLRDVDISRSEELANRLSVLYQALIDQLDDSQHAGARGQLAGRPPGAHEIGERLRSQGQELLATFARFVGQLRSGPLPFRNWGEICDRLDELAGRFRDYVRTENEFARPTSRSSGSRDGSTANERT